MSIKSTASPDKPVNLTVISRNAEQHIAHTLAKLPKPVQTLKDQAIDWLAERVEVTASKVDDALFELASHAFAQSEQDSYFFAMRELRSNQTATLKQFKNTIESGFCACVEQPDGKEGISAESLSVIANDDMDEILAIEAVVKKGVTQNKTALEHLVQRLDAVCISDGSIDNMPLSPHKICSAFKQATEELRLPVNARLVLFKVIEQELIARLPEMYRQMNKLLAERGILPTIQNAPKASPHTASQKRRLTRPVDEGLMGAPVSLDDDSAAAPQAQPFVGAYCSTPAGEHYGASQATADESLSLASIAAQLKELQGSLHNHNNEATIQHGPSNGAGSSHSHPSGTLDTARLLNVLSMVQSSMTPGSQTRPGNLMKAITRMSGDMSEALRSSPQGQNLRVVDGLFNAMLTEQSLANPLKELLARLQIPLARAAVVDNERIFRPDHSARKLVNAIASAGVALNVEDGEALQNDPLYKKMSEIVDRAVQEYDTDSQLFTDLLVDFETFTRRDQKRLEVLEKRILDAEEGRAKSERARLTVAQAIVEIGEGRDLRSAINEFIHKAWHQVMFVVCIKDGVDSDRWRDVIATASKLVEATQNLQSYVECEKSRLAFPGLAEKIKQGFELIHFDAFEGDQILKKLEALFKSLKPYVLDEPTAPSNGSTADKAAAGEKGATAEVSPASMPTFSDGISALVAERRKRELAEKKAASAVDEKFFAQAKALCRGSWLDYTKRNAPTMRCRLAAVIESTSTYIFVNRSGQKVMEKSLLALAFAFKNGELTTVDSGQLFDRALERVIVSMRKSDGAK
ncbi:MAG TPA: DUF1631 family protein [Marinagarivorans sp.]